MSKHSYSTDSSNFGLQLARQLETPEEALVRWCASNSLR